MERTITRDRNIYIFSGHMGVGKSYLFGYFTSLPENRGPHVLVSSKDQTLAKYFGCRINGWPADDFSQARMLAIFEKMTPSERLYADELLRADVSRAILIGDIEKVFLDMSMRSREKYQKPFVEIARHTEEWLVLFEAERAKEHRLLPPDPAPTVNLKVVFLFCDFETILRRMRARWPHLPKNQLPEPIRETLPNFPIPTEYPFLAVNTSDESPEADRKRKEEIRRFFSEKIPDPELVASRAKEAEKCLEATNREIQRFL